MKISMGEYYDLHDYRNLQTGKVQEIYQRLEDKGRMQPEGLVYINSRIDEKMEKCYQIMETDSEDKIHHWISNWDDVMEFEIVPVISSAEAKSKVLSH